MPRIIVAAFGPAAKFLPDEYHFLGPTFEDQGAYLAWADRWKLEFAAAEAMTLSAVIETAAERFGVATRPNERGDSPAVSDVVVGPAFYRPADAFRVDRPQPWPRTFVIVDADQRARWGRDTAQITIADLLRTSDAGLLQGDPRRIYFWPMIPQGGGVAGAWVSLLPILWQCLRALEEVGGIAEGARVVSSALSRLKNLRSFEETGSAMADRDGSPTDLIDLLIQRPRTSEELARLIGARPECLAQSASILGFVQDTEDGLWRPGEDVAGQLLYEMVRLAIEQSLIGVEGAELVADAFAKTVLRTVESGRVPVGYMRQQWIDRWIP